MEQQNFFQKYKVLIFGLFTAILTVLYGFLGNPVTDWIAVGYACFIAAGSYLARNLRGQWITIIPGIILPTAAVIYDAHAKHTDLNIGYLIVGVSLQVLAAMSSPPKDRTYEHSPTIVQAKVEAEQIKTEVAQLKQVDIDKEVSDVLNKK